MHVVWEGALVRLRPLWTIEECSGLLEEVCLEPDEFWGYGWWVRSRLEQSFTENAQIGVSSTWSIFAVDRLDTGELVGYEVVGMPHPQAICAEIGTVILQRHWHRGFGRDAKRLALSLLFENYPLERVDATTMDKHRRARTGLEACGLHLEGVLRDSAYSMGRRAGMAKYVIFREQWERLPYRQHVRRGGQLSRQVEK